MENQLLDEQSNLSLNGSITDAEAESAGLADVLQYAKDVHTSPKPQTDPYEQGIWSIFCQLYEEFKPSFSGSSSWLLLVRIDLEKEPFS